MSVAFLHEIYSRLQDEDNKTACVIEDTVCTYREFKRLTGSIQRKVQRTGSQHIGIVTQNTPETYATIIAAWLTGKAYVPIPLHYPTDRIDEIINRAEIGSIFYAETTEEIDLLQQTFPQIEFLCSKDLPESDCFHAYPTEDKTAYILFTSGTTGKPKGVPITFGNLQAFMTGLDTPEYAIRYDDRFLQMFDLTFDLSVVSFARPLMSGASFYTLPTGMIKTLALYHVLDEYQITVSLMVPSAIGLLLPYLDDIHLPQLRISQFCGEALKKDLLTKWMPCVPNAQIKNVYGPTEATIFCTSLSCSTQKILQHNGIVGIGKPMRETTMLLVNEVGDIISDPKVEGELCLGGKQITPGYIHNEEQNREKFFEYNQQRYYKTGDIAYRDKSNNYFYVGRKDDQVKIQGYRIELAELEFAAARIIPDKQTVAVGYQHDESWYLALFIHDNPINELSLQEKLKPLLPAYMQPHRVFGITEIPLNSNGKTDRKALRRMAEEQHRQG
jgi:amino acid adenylation domain-containing protein